MLFMSRLSGPRLRGGWIGLAINHWPYPARERADYSGQNPEVKRGGPP